MRKLAIVVALSSTAIATPALARDGAWYVGGDFGAMIVEDVEMDVGAIENALVIDHDYGFDGAGFVGYDLGAFRLEAEVAYKRARLDSLDGTVGLPGDARPGVAGGLQIREAAGNTTALSFMINGMLDFGDDDGVSGFLGGGVGVARVSFNNQRVFSNQGAFLDDSDTRFAWQVVAGLRQAISDSADVTVRYRFFNVPSLEMIGFGGNEFSTRLRTHSILGGITFNFGAPEPVIPIPPPVIVTPPPPIVAPPPVVPNVECPNGQTLPPGSTCPIPGPFIVFFDWDRDEITPQAAGILDNAAEQYRTTGNAQVVLAGHADRSGSDQYNVGLSQRRAENVRQYLAGRGIPEGVMRTEAFGESRPAVETADGVREPQNRRVEITFGPGSGW
ncbi:MAG: OmpA-OmpF porin, family [Sphingomonadales bacterium]|jgi:outer membrane protein OmpA-like peptidoglycan-associated protein/opacity protein-like surface antigen|nr:OmpA-OmpF porin, family [Sphingomonadales bacterium]